MPLPENISADYTLRPSELHYPSCLVLTVPAALRAGA